MTPSERLGAEQARRSLKRFIVEGWDQVEASAPFLDNWHIDAICDHLAALRTGDILNLVINVPPGHMKSLTCSVFFLPWWWIDEPWIRSLHASYASELSTRDGRKTTQLLRSKWYRDRYGDSFNLTKETEHRLENDQGGLRISSSVGGIGTGERAHITVNDDLVRANDAHSEAAKKTAIEHMRAMSTRGVPGFPFRQLLIMQRLHENDPTGWVLSQELGFEHLCLPAEFDPVRRCTTSIGFVDPRKEEGEALWPSSFPADQLAKQRVMLGEYGYSGQFQQQPVPAGGGIVKTHWWGEYGTRLAQYKRIIHSWDTAFKAKQENDFSCCTVWGEHDNGYDLLDVIKVKLEFPDLKRRVIDLHSRDNPHAVLIEDAASGQDLIAELRRETKIPIVPIPLRGGDKIARLHSVTPSIEAGLVRLPKTAEWLADFRHSISMFPNGAHDDDVDSMTQALQYMTRGGGAVGMLDFIASEAAARKADAEGNKG